MNNLPQAIFIDVDGTLRNSKGEISLRNREALQLAQQHGIQTVICTGRPRGHALELCREIQSGDYCVICNGAGVLDVANDRLLYKSLIPKESALRLLDLVQSVPGGEEIFWNYECVDAHYLSRSVPGHMHGKVVVEEPISDFLSNHEVMQIVACHEADTKYVDNFFANTDDQNTSQYEKSTDLMRKVRQMIIDSNFGLKVLNQQKHMIDPNFPPVGIPYVDVGNATTDKGLGVREFCRLMQFSPQNCVAIGDDDNDFGMFEECGMKVAMANALPEILAIADYTTTDNDHDGVADFIEKLVALTV